MMPFNKKIDLLLKINISTFSQIFVVKKIHGNIFLNVIFSLKNRLMSASFKLKIYHSLLLS